MVTLLSLYVGLLLNRRCEGCRECLVKVQLSIEAREKFRCDF